MADFPPNLEDGEQWLPSDIYQEIVSGNFRLEALVDNITLECDTEVESSELGDTKVLNEQNYLFPVIGKGEALKGSVGNSGGTGVFLPLTTTLKVSNEPIKGTGVFLKSFAAKTSSRKKKKSGKNEQGIEKNASKKLGTPKKKNKCQFSSEICLPQEWTY